MSTSILIILFLKVDFYNVINILKRVNLNYLMLALLVSLVGSVFLPADKWRRVLKGLGYRLGYRKALFIKLGSAPIDVILPLRTGELFKVMYLNKYHGITIGKSLSSIIFDKILNLWAILVIFFIGINFTRAAISLKIFSLIFILTSIVVWERRIWIFLHFFTKKIHLSLNNFVKQLTSAFEEISVKYKIFLGSYSLLDMFLEIVVFYILFKAMKVELPFNAIVNYAALVMLVSSIPLVLMGMGLREASILLVFSKYASPAILLSLGILITLISHLLPRMVGLFLLIPFLSRLFGNYQVENG